ncbi:MAG: FAD binding domain-containing protein [Pseudomonadota bacterium]
MKPVDFKHDNAGEIKAAAESIATSDGDVKFISGGQSLGPMLNLRLARPTGVIGVTKIPQLKEVTQKRDFIQFGAAICHADFEDGKLPEPIPGMMRKVASGIAYRAVRNRGTIGGSLCHADPAADWMTAITALDAMLVAFSRSSGERIIPITKFMHGAYRTELRQDEILTAIKVPVYSSNAVWGYYKICRKVGEFADAIASWVADPKKQYSRVVFGSTSGAPFVSEKLSASIASKGEIPTEAEIFEALTDCPGAENPVKRQLFSVALQRCIKQVFAHE